MFWLVSCSTYTFDKIKFAHLTDNDLDFRGNFMYCQATGTGPGPGIGIGPGIGDWGLGMGMGIGDWGWGWGQQGQEHLSPVHQKVSYIHAKCELLCFSASENIRVCKGQKGE